MEYLEEVGTEEGGVKAEVGRLGTVFRAVRIGRPVQAIIFWYRALSLQRQFSYQGKGIFLKKALHTYPKGR